MTQITVKAGDILIHPAHGKMKVTNVSPHGYEEYIPDAKAYVKGHQIEAAFDKFIPGVKWVANNPNGQRISKLVFHSWYLKNLKRG